MKQLLFAPLVFIFLWDSLYFSRDNGFWEKIGTKPSWGNNQALFITLYVILTFLIFFLLYPRYKNQRIILLIFYLLFIIFMAIPYTLSYGRLNETFVFSSILVGLTVVILFFTFSWKIKELVHQASIFSILIYLYAWFENVKHN